MLPAWSPTDFPLVPQICIYSAHCTVSYFDLCRSEIWRHFAFCIVLGAAAFDLHFVSSYLLAKWDVWASTGLLSPTPSPPFHNLLHNQCQVVSRPRPTPTHSEHRNLTGNAKSLCTQKLKWVNCYCSSQERDTQTKTKPAKTGRKW